MAHKNKGRIRFVIEWQELTASAKIRRQDPDYDHDRDRDEQTLYETKSTLEDARLRAKEISRDYACLYEVTIQEEHYLPIEGTVHFDWEPIGEPERW